MISSTTMPRLTRRLLAASALVVFAAACDDDPADPGAMPMAEIQASATEFADTELAVGTDETILIEVRNTGDGELALSSIEIVGDDASHFTLVEGQDMTSLAPGGERQIAVGFTPTSEGMKTAAVAISTNDPMQNRVEISVTGMAARYQYSQVDRKGIPGLNTVFNHPSGVGPFDKRAYNLASPADDVANYTGLFETVLGAVGNADPAATAALLLPDALPVSLGAATTSFATLTGRALADDAVDVALSVTVGAPALHSDNVDANDKAFLTTFPYVAPPHE